MERQTQTQSIQVDLQGLTSGQCFDYSAYMQRMVEMKNARKGNLTGYDCPKCLNRGKFYLLSEDNCESVKYCDCMEIRKAIKRLEDSELEGSIRKNRFDNYETNSDWQAYIKSRAFEFLEDKTIGKWFFIGGQTGCGKTHICTAICGKLIKEYPVSYMLWKDEATAIKAVVNNEKEYYKLVNPLKNVKVLYIDDFWKTGDKKPPTAGDMNLAFEILNYRYFHENLITIISSEWLLQEIIALEEAIGGRINQAAKKHILNISPDRKKNYRLV